MNFKNPTKRLRHWIGLFKRRAVAPAAPSAAAPCFEALEPRVLLSGTTIISHGAVDALGFGEPGPPEWVAGTASAIANRIEAEHKDKSGNVAQFRMELEDSFGTNLDVTEWQFFNGYAPSTARDQFDPEAIKSALQGESIIALDWAESAQWLEEQTEDVAQVAADYLVSELGELGNMLLSSPIHLIGHSRGGSVVSALAKSLGEIGISVDQVTTLDPHPTSNDYGNGIFDEITVTNNVVFADNYWRRDGLVGGGDFDGEEIIGARNWELEEGRLDSLIDGVWPFGEDPGYWGAHSDVHAWYYGTIDPDSPTINNGDPEFEPVDPDLHDWYGGDHPSRNAEGYNYTIFDSDSLAKFAPTGLHEDISGGSGARLEVPEEGAQWANVFDLSVDVGSSGGYVEVGEAIQSSYRLLDRDGSATLEWFVDDNRNPFDAFDGKDAFDSQGPTLITTTDSSFNIGSPHTATLPTSALGDLSDFDFGQDYHIGVKAVSDNGDTSNGARARYAYSDPFGIEEPINPSQDPVVGSVVANPDTLAPSERFTLNATGVSDSDGWVDAVEFFRFESGNDPLMGRDTTPSDGWAVDVDAPSTPGTYRYYAAAINNDGVRTPPSETPVATVEVQGDTSPTLSSISPSTLEPLPLSQTQSLTVHGSNFTSFTELRFRDTEGNTHISDDARLTFVSPTELRYDLVVGQDEGQWDVWAVNGNADSKIEHFEVEKTPTTTNKPDLRGVAFDANPASLEPGANVSVDFQIENAGEEAAGPFDVQFYLSRDGEVTDSDHYVGGYFGLDSDLAAGAMTSELSTALAPMPEADHSFWSGDGQYTIGMIVDRRLSGGENVDESNEVNNANRGNGLDKVAVDVSGLGGGGNNIDLLASSFDFSPDRLAAGDSADIDYTIANDGSADASGFELGFYLSDDVEIGSDDYRLADVDLGGLNGGRELSRSQSVTLPGRGDDFWSGDGTYYTGVVVDEEGDVAESDESNNASTGSDRDAIRVTDTRRPAGISVADVSVLERNFFDSEAVFTVTVDRAGVDEWGADYTLVPGTATPDEDYDDKSGSFSVHGGQTEHEITVDVEGDSEVEADETFFLELSSPVGATISDGRAKATIRDNDTEGANSPRHAWSTYIGGDFVDQANDVNTDELGNSYVVGETQPVSEDWVSEGYDVQYDSDAKVGFVAKFAPGGDHIWSTYWEDVFSFDDVVTDEDGNVYAGSSGSQVVSFSANGALRWASGGLGGSSLRMTDEGLVGLAGDQIVIFDTHGNAIREIGVSKSGYRPDAMTVAGDGSIYHAGKTRTTGLATGDVASSHNGRNDVFLEKLNADGSIAWSTYLGGVWHEEANSLLVDDTGDLIVVGTTSSSDWANTNEDAPIGDDNIFVTRFSSEGRLDSFDRYAANSGETEARDAAFSRSGSLMITGNTDGDDWSHGVFDNNFHGSEELDMFVIELDSGHNVEWGTLLGSNQTDVGWGVAIDQVGDVYVTGQTAGGWVAGGWDEVPEASRTGFLAKLDMPDVPLPEIQVNAGGSQVGSEYDFGEVEQGSAGNEVSFTALNEGDAPLTLNLQPQDIPAGFTLIGPLSTTLAPGTSDTFSIRLESSIRGNRAGQIAIGTNDPDENPFNFAITGEVTPPTFGSIGDVVWHDLDGDGAQDGNEPGVENVTVNLLDDQGVATGQTAKTDADGRYLFDDLASGDYIVEFADLPEGFAFTQQDAGGDDVLDSDTDPGTGQTGVITLAAGEDNGTIDAGLVLERVSVIASAVNPANGHTYHLFISPQLGRAQEGMVSWEVGEQLAQSEFGGHLATINDQAENDWIRQTFTGDTGGPNNDRFWIGLNDIDSEGNHVWANGSSSAYRNWHAGNPGGAGDEDVVEMRPSGQWNDGSVGSHNPALVEVSPGGVEIETSGNGVLIENDDATPSAGDHTDFGQAVQGGASLTRTFTVRNMGTAALTTSQLMVPAGYTVTEDLSASIAAGEQDTFTVELSTTAAGTFAGQISFNTNDDDENPFNFSITGEVEATEGSLLVGVGSHGLLADTADQQIELFVTGGANVAGLNFNAQVADGESGPIISDVDLETGTILAGNNTGQTDNGSNDRQKFFSITTSNGTVAAEGLFATLTVDTSGIFDGEFDLTLTDVLGSLDTEFLDASAQVIPATISAGDLHIVAPEVSVTMGGDEITDGQSDSIDFGSVVAGESSSEVTFTVTNEGDADLTLGDLTLPSGFEVVEGLAGALAPAASDTFTVRWTPSGIGEKSGSITFNTNDSDESVFDFPVEGLVTLLIDASDHRIVADRAGQEIEILVAGGGDVAGLDLALQMADGTSGPLVTDVDLETGTIFANNNSGQTDNGSTDRRKFFSITTSSGTVTAEGLLATLTLDTTGITEEGEYTFTLTDVLGSDTQLLDAAAASLPVTFRGGTLEVVQTFVVDRHVFYNDSFFDGEDATANTTDDDAIAPNKQVLLPGETATRSNVSNYSRGINGVMIDVSGLAAPKSLNTSDFEFLVGNDENIGTWTNGPAPSSVTVREGAGTDGSDRITLTWADGAISGQWLQVRLKSTEQSGLAEDDVFYFGNAVGEARNNTNDAAVNAIDELLARANPHSPLNPAPITSRFDFNHDGLVNAQDQLISRANRTSPLTALRLVDVPDVAAAASSAAQLEHTPSGQDEQAVAQSPSVLSAAAVAWRSQRERALHPTIPTFRASPLDRIIAQKVTLLDVGSEEDRPWGGGINKLAGFEAPIYGRLSSAP